MIFPKNKIIVPENRTVFFIALAVFLLAALFLIGVAFKFLIKKTEPPPLTQVIAPWDYADDVLAEAPEIPSTEELYNLFLEARKAIQENDQEAMQAKLSYQLIWQSENPLEYAGENEHGVVLYDRRDISSEDYFQERLTFSPAPEQIVPLEIIPFKEKAFSENQSVLLRNKATDKTEQLVITPWRYLIRLKAKRVDNLGGPKEGYIIFVYDQGAWRYHAENWLAK